MLVASILSQSDPWIWALILTKFLIYATSLMAAGLVFFQFMQSRGHVPSNLPVAKVVLVLTWLLAVLALLMVMLQAGFLGGGTLQAALDPFLLKLVLGGGQGRETALMLLGLVLMHGILIRSRFGQGLALLGALILLLSFTQTGHTITDSRWLLGPLLLIHLVLISFWVGALWPLYRIAGDHQSMATQVATLRWFGQVSLISVPLLVLAGMVLLGFLVGGIAPIFTTPYGQIILLKLLLVATLLSLAASNKWYWVPRIAANSSLAARRLRQSIMAEGAIFVLIFASMAILTTTVGPERGY